MAHAAHHIWTVSDDNTIMLWSSKVSEVMLVSYYCTQMLSALLIDY